MIAILVVTLVLLSYLMYRYLRFAQDLGSMWDAMLCMAVLMLVVPHILVPILKHLEVIQ